MTVGSLFSGIGGIDLGLERAGMEVRWQVEVDLWCQRVLEKHWPDVTRYGDIKEVDFAEVEPVDLLAGGFPCQPVSLAGRRNGQDDPRWLWPEFARAIRDLRPRWVLAENTPGLLTIGLGDVLRDLAGLGYDAEWAVLSAAQFGAPHLRRRVWIVAQAHHQWELQPERGQPYERGWIGHSSKMENSTGPGRGPEGATTPGEEGEGRSFHQFGGSGEVVDTDHQHGDFSRYGASQIFWEWRETSRLFKCPGGTWPVEPAVGRMAHGIPRRMDRIRGLGNAVVPQIVEWIGGRIMAEWRSR